MTVPPKHILDKTNPSLDLLIQKFDATEAAYQALARSTGVLDEIGRAVHRFLETVWPEIKPYVMAGVDMVAVAAGAAVGPLAPLVSYVVSAFGKAGLAALVLWLTEKTSPGAPEASPA